MAGLRNVAGTGYGSAYVDALIGGGPVWDMSSGWIKFWFGQPYQRVEAFAAHGPSKAYSSPDGPVPYLADGGSTNEWATAVSWYDDTKGFFADAVDQFERVSGIRFDLASNLTNANVVGWLASVPPQNVWGDSERPEYKNAATRTGQKQSWIYLDAFEGDGDDEGSYNNIHPGGLGFTTMLQMIGVAVGLTHPYDDPADSFPGLKNRYDVGPDGQNQAPFTAMSVNVGYQGSAHPTGAWGSMKTLGALDIAALQRLYGADTTAAPGNDVYVLPAETKKIGEWGEAKAPGWSCIWDTGGNDTITAVSSLSSVTIDLRPATLMNNDPHAGGYISQKAGIAGGFTIANGVTIENAVGGFGNDLINGNSAPNKLEGGSGNDTINGDAGDDTIDGGPGADVMNGGSGNDVYYVDNAADQIIDSDGMDTVIASVPFAIPDGIEIFIATGSAAVNMAGNALNNSLTGNSGANKLSGGAGNDTLSGRGGKDVLTGGSGKDVFVFDTKPTKSAVPTVTDFNVKDDTIWLDNAIFTKLGKKGTPTSPAKLDKRFFTIGDKAKDKDDYIVYDKTKGTLSYDADGSGAGKAVVFAMLPKNLKMTVADFMVI
ncbi:M10 family metallopeptidase C-terminal domain-containing protein [Microvirga alba]|uniref:M10 family metallopeptidase C-terminal domain-containing protein n=1 Tax=Microvirga alba TaxID=2791025 RepID=A0A931BM37_9HYPH|nr:M10 family metallopeptidase C-terminal domain-containing protein [Microvirga alba]MBF9231855.1 M10 family metallopeptidase C-terminal domain-containing protein [Microvirga alba]